MTKQPPDASWIEFEPVVPGMFMTFWRWLSRTHSPDEGLDAWETDGGAVHE